MSTEQFNEPTEEEIRLVPQQTSTAMVEVEKSKAVQEVQAALVIGKKFPRDEISARQKILTACQRYDLAEKAEFAFPRGGQTVRGPSIRLAEVLAQNWGNLRYGFREIDNESGRSTVQSYCWDVQTNTMAERTFTVEHWIQKKDGAKKKLTDPRDIYELIANNAQRRVRACIMEVIPSDVTEKAIQQCRETMKKGEGNVPLIDRIARMVQMFAQLGITKDLIEKRSKCTVEQMTVEHIADFTAIYNSLKEGNSKREDWFDFKSPTEGGKADKLNSLAN